MHISTSADSVRERRNGTSRGVVLLEQLPLVTYVAQFDDPRTLEYVSPQVCGLLGFAAEEPPLEPAFWADRVVVDDRERVEAACDAVRSTGEHATSSTDCRPTMGARCGCEMPQSSTLVRTGSPPCRAFSRTSRERRSSSSGSPESASRRTPSSGSRPWAWRSPMPRAATSASTKRSPACTAPVEEHIGRRLGDVDPTLAGYVEPLVDEVGERASDNGRQLDIE